MWRLIAVLILAIGPASAQALVQRSTLGASPAVRAAEATVREALARDLSSTLTAEDKAGDLKQFLAAPLYRAFSKGARDFDGDPFTGSQEPEPYAVTLISSIQLSPGRVDVTVRFDITALPDLHPVIRYEMAEIVGRWQATDIFYVTDKQSMRAILKRMR
jgi:hypothetical protein